MNPINKVFLVKRITMNQEEWEYDELIAVCSTLEKAREYIELPNFDRFITEYTVDGGPDSEVLIENFQPNDPYSI
jgi:hypothetical protein